MKNDMDDKEIEHIVEQHEWLHKCKNGEIRPYASVLCSMCRNGIDVGISKEYLKKLGYIKVESLPNADEILAILMAQGSWKINTRPFKVECINPYGEPIMNKVAEVIYKRMQKGLEC